MNIRMLRTQTGSVDGVHIDTYQAGAEYDMGKSEKHRELADVFISQRWAEVATDQLQIAAERIPEITDPAQSPAPNVKVSHKKRRTIKEKECQQSQQPA